MSQQVERPELLSPSEWSIFLVLSLRHPLSVKEIGQELARRDPEFRQGISTLSTLLQRLMARGYVRRKVPPSSTTPILYEPIVSLEPAFRTHADRFVSSFTQLRREQLELLLEVVKDHLQKLPPPLGPRRLN